jgi:hypothetical protein
VNERGALGLWINRLSLLALELSFEHEIQSEDDGHWRLKALEEGKLVARYANGDQRGIDLRKGDTVLATPTEVYVGLAERRTPKRIKPKQTKPAPARARKRPSTKRGEG